MLLQGQGLTREYIRFGKPFRAVDGTNLSIQAGELAGIVGSSGSGKTTLLTMLAGLNRPSAGTVTLAGQDLYSLGAESLALLQNSHIGFLPQGDTLLYNLSIWDNVLLPWFLFPRQGEPERTAGDLLQVLGIDHLADSFLTGLSEGELRRVEIAKALINTPELVLADEPTSSLDRETSLEIMRVFRKVAEAGAAVILVTHKPELLESADRIYHMHDGLCST